MFHYSQSETIIFGLNSVTVSVRSFYYGVGLGLNSKVCFLFEKLQFWNMGRGVAVADLMGREGCAPTCGSKFFQFHAVFGKSWQNCMLAPQPGELAPPPRANPGSATGLGLGPYVQPLNHCNIPYIICGVYCETKSMKTRNIKRKIGTLRLNTYSEEKALGFVIIIPLHKVFSAVNSIDLNKSRVTSLSTRTSRK